MASITNGQVLFYHADHLGGANVVTDIDADIKEISEYEPFGAYAKHDKLGTDEEVAWYYFTSHYKDEETGLYFMQARYYDPQLGRFITPDTIVQDPTNPVTMNRYQYSGNNPVNNIDPDGHGFWKSFIAAFIGAVATIVTAGIAAGGFAALYASIQSVGFASAIGTGAFAVGGAVAGVTGAALN